MNRPVNTIIINQRHISHIYSPMKTLSWIFYNKNDVYLNAIKSVKEVITIESGFVNI